MSEKRPKVVPPGYEIIGHLGSGGMGDVYKARHLALDKIVALKITKVQSDTVSGKQTNERAIREARMVARLSHPNIAQITNCFQLGDLTYIEMEYLQGSTLAELFEHEDKGAFGKHFVPGTNRLQHHFATHIGVQMCAALGTAHQSGLIHRDVKPSNIFIQHNGIAKLIDFGIAQEDSGQRLTKTGVVIGTPAYMSPEQIQGLPVDERSDIYSFGCVLFYCLTGRIPFQDTSDLMICIGHLKNPPPDPIELNPDLSPKLRDIVMKCLAKAKEDRYASMWELQDELASLSAGADVPPKGARTPIGSQAFVSTRTVHQGMIEREAAASAPTMTTLIPTPVPTQPEAPRKRSSGMAMTAAILVVMGLAAAGYVVMQDPDRAKAFLAQIANGNIPGTDDVPLPPPLPTPTPTPAATPTLAPAMAVDGVTSGALSTAREAAPTATPSPAPTLTPTPTPVPLHALLATPVAMPVEVPPWQAIVDWTAPQQQRFTLTQPRLASEQIELTDGQFSITLQNPSASPISVSLIARIASSNVAVQRQPFALLRSPEKLVNVCLGAAFKDLAPPPDDLTVVDGKALEMPAWGILKVPIHTTETDGKALLREELRLESLVVVGRGKRISTDLRGFDPNQRELDRLSAALADMPTTQSMALNLQFLQPTTLNQAFRDILAQQIQVNLGAPPANPAAAEAIPDQQAMANVLQFLAHVEQQSRAGRLLRTSQYDVKRLIATPNGGCQLVLTLEAEPGTYLVSAVVLAGKQTVTVDHEGGKQLRGVRPLSGFLVLRTEVNVHQRLRTDVTIPLFGWAFQPQQIFIPVSNIEVDRLAVVVEKQESNGTNEARPSFRVFPPLQATFGQ